MTESMRFHRKTDHVCRKCFARVFKCVDEAGDHWVECSNCGYAKKSTRPESICSCGYKLRVKGQHVSKWPNAKFRCRKNPNPTPEMPAQIIVIHTGDEHEQEQEEAIQEV